MRALMVTFRNSKGIPFADLIVSGKKTWEIRKRNTRIRGRIGIVRGDNKLVGTVRLVKVIGPTTPEYIAKFPYYAATLRGIRDYAKGKPLYAWVLADAKRLKPRTVKVKFLNRYDWIRC